MIIKFEKIFKSIDKFDEVNIENFSIFLGVNGSGKTHLLQALKEGSFFADDIPIKNILYFNLQTFLIENQSQAIPRDVNNINLRAWNNFKSNYNQNSYKKYDDGIKKIIGDVKHPYSVDVFKDINISEENKALYNQFRGNITDFIGMLTADDPQAKESLRINIFKSGKYTSDLTKNDFLKFIDYTLPDYNLLKNLSMIFLDYLMKLEGAKLPIESGGQGLSKEEVDKRQENSPWNLINNMFREFGLPHSVSYPEFQALDFLHNNATSFQTKLFIDDKEIDFSDLSSGEKILCALIVTIYQDNRSRFPKLLLLDEVDASLHPSIIKNLLDVINNVFIKNNCKVILATHSPTTVALAPEDSLFEVQKGKGLKKIKKISQSDAIELLSEGFITFEKGLKFQKGIDTKKQLQIISEGNNADHIQKAIEILDTSLLDQINILRNGLGAVELKNAFNVLSSAGHINKFLFVWDCDFSTKVDTINESKNFKKFCFLENPNNTKAKSRKKASGIENLYPDSLFIGEIYTKNEDPGFGGAEPSTYLDKQKFLKKIKQQTDSTVFANFQPLINKIRELLNPDN